MKEDGLILLMIFHSFMLRSSRRAIVRCFPSFFIAMIEDAFSCSVINDLKIVSFSSTSNNSCSASVIKRMGPATRLIPFDLNNLSASAMSERIRRGSKSLFSFPCILLTVSCIFCSMEPISLCVSLSLSLSLSLPLIL